MTTPVTSVHPTLNQPSKDDDSCRQRLNQSSGEDDSCSLSFFSTERSVSLRMRPLGHVAALASRSQEPVFAIFHTIKVTPGTLSQH